MADALTTVTNFIASPPGQVVAGGALAGGVFKFFGWVESLLTENTKLEIAVWLVGVKMGQTIQPWPDTFAKMFDRVFGTRHLSWRCFWRSCVATYAGLLVGSWFYPVRLISWDGFTILSAFIVTVIVCVVPDYLSLLKTRLLIQAMIRFRLPLLNIALILFDFVATFTISITIMTLSIAVQRLYNGEHITVTDLYRNFLGFAEIYTHVGSLKEGQSNIGFLFVPAFFTCIWVSLYTTSGLILKAARHFDVGLNWFNSKFDIEKKPLSAMGFVGGVLVAVLWWTAAAIRYFV